MRIEWRMCSPNTSIKLGHKQSYILFRNFDANLRDMGQWIIAHTGVHTIQ